MRMASLERAILFDAKRFFNNKKLRMKDIMEWSTGDIMPQDGEVVERVNGIYVAIKTGDDKRVKE